MKITSIKQQVKRVNRYSIYIDDKYSFSLSDGELLNTGLVPNQELTVEQLTELKDTARIDKGFSSALGLLARRARSRWELEQYLTRKEYDAPTSVVILNKLSKYGYVNDEAFATAWVENRRLLKATSRRRLTQELRQKRVPDEIIQKVLAEDETDERSILTDLVARKRKQTKYQDSLKLMQYLSRQGFSYDDIKTAIQEADE
jgi:regulatory protein